MITDKSTSIQILGTLIKNPLLLNNPDYSLSPSDFNTSFEKQIFGAIYNLFSNGVEKISEVDIDSYLQNYEGVYQNFISNNGIEFLQDCIEISTPENFNYYYTKLKKYNLLNDLSNQGIDISDIYPNDILDKDYNKKMDRFEELSIQDIFNTIKLKINSIETNYECKDNITTVKAGFDIRELLAKVQSSPDIGTPLQGDIYNTVVRGARLGRYYIRSADSGTGKTRSMVGEACKIAYPFYYNQANQRWEYTGSNEKVLYVGTEQEYTEIQTMILAYLTGINEETILYGLYNEEEKDIIEKGCKIMDYFADNLTITQIPDPDVKSVKAKIRQEVLQNNIGYVFYDYIFSSPALLREFGDVRLREDVVLMIMSTALKDLAVELNVFLQTSTQVTINENERTKMKTKASIRGSKSIADKADIGVVLSRVTEEELKLLQESINLIGITPNQVTDVYKVRQGKYNNVRIWSYFDAGTCRRKDLFITDASMNSVQNFRPLDIKINLENTNELDKLLLNLNGLELNQETGEVIDKSQVLEEEKEETLVIEETKKELDWSDLI